jgi:hypothetical protein
MTQTTFNLLKQAFMTTPILHPTKPFQVKMEASDFAIGAILSQLHEVSILHLVAYYSYKFTTPEVNYPIYDKELLAIIVAFKKWSSYLAGAPSECLQITTI